MLPQSQIVFPGSLAPDAPRDMIAALGKNGQIINVVPSQNLVVVRMGEAPDTSFFVPNVFNNQIWQRLNRIICNQTSVAGSSATPASFTLMQNYPNPFNPSAKVSFVIGHSSFVSLKVFDVLGREVAALANEQLVPGTHERTFDASGLSSGVYLYRLTAGAFTSTKRMLLLK
jgi:hypothetical protein